MEVKKRNPAEAPSPDSDSLCVYDLTRSKLVSYHNLCELDDAAISGVSHFSGDNRGFLAETTSDMTAVAGFDAVVFVEWSRKQRHFTVSWTVLQAQEDMKKEEDLRKTGSHFAADITPAHWEQSRFVVPFYQGTVVVDTAALTIHYRPNAGVAQILDYSKSHRAMVAQIRSGVLIQSREVSDGGKGRSCIELRHRGQAGAPWSTVRVRTVDDVLGIQVSSNREHALIHYADADKHGRLIINAAGKIVGDIR